MRFRGHGNGGGCGRCGSRFRARFRGPATSSRGLCGRPDRAEHVAAGSPSATPRPHRRKERLTRVDLRGLGMREATLTAAAASPSIAGRHSSVVGLIRPTQSGTWHRNASSNISAVKPRQQASGGAQSFSFCARGRPQSSSSADTDADSRYVGRVAADAYERSLCANGDDQAGLLPQLLIAGTTQTLGSGSLTSSLDARERRPSHPRRLRRSR